MSTGVKWLIGVVIIVVLVPVLLLLSVLVAGAASAEPAHQNCYSKTWTKWLGVTPFPNVATEVRLTARACVWTNSAGGHYTGQVVKSSVSSTQKFDPNGWASFYGLEFWRYDKYNLAIDDHAFDAADAYHDKWRQCQNIGGITVCNPTGNYVIGFEFNSPHLVQHSDGLKVWDFIWHKGEPGRTPDKADNLIYIRDHD